MFELAIDSSLAERLRLEDRIDSSCGLAAVIRGGKSVYCWALAVRVR